MTTVKISSTGFNSNGSSKIWVDGKEVERTSYIRLEIEAGYPSKLSIDRYCLSAEESDRLQQEGWEIEEPSMESETTYIPRTARITFGLKQSEFTGEILGRL